MYLCHVLLELTTTINGIQMDYQETCNKFEGQHILLWSLWKHNVDSYYTSNVANFKSMDFKKYIVHKKLPFKQL
jgi:hypothetical protein